VLKRLDDTEVRDNDHSNIYDIFKYDTSILFFMIKNTLFFSDFFLKFIEFVRTTSIDTY
jgi:hypothetical protein